MKKEVEVVLKGIKTDKSPGADKVHPWTMSGPKQEIAGPFSSSLSTGDVLDD